MSAKSTQALRRDLLSNRVEARFYEEPLGHMVRRIVEPSLA